MALAAIGAQVWLLLWVVVGWLVPGLQWPWQRPCTKRGLAKAEANELSVRLELQADCLAGVWAHRAQRARDILEPGDLEEAMNAAGAVGDDRIQRRSQGYVVPDSFTHGTSRQRVEWFTRGWQSGDADSCETFRTALR